MTKKIVIIGLGYVGLPLALSVSKVFDEVIGFDYDSKVVSKINSGNGILKGVNLETFNFNKFRASSDSSDLENFDIAIICVPTPLDKDGNPDLSYVTSATLLIKPYLKSNALVISESTSFPGTTRNLIGVILTSDKMRPGLDFHLAFSSERVDPGNKHYGIKTIPKVVGGINDQSRDKATEFYSDFIDEVIAAKGLEEAELSKLIENSYRSINIAFVNELAILCHRMNIDVWDSLHCAATKPFGYQSFFPGPGVGGHCVAIDPAYLNYELRLRTNEVSKLIETSLEINKGMPSYIVQRIMNILVLKNGDASLDSSKVLLIGMTYKADVPDFRESPAIQIFQELDELGILVDFYDPYLDEIVINGTTRKVANSVLETCTNSDLVVLLQHHRDLDMDSIVRHGRTIFDTRGRLDANNVIKL